MRGRDAQGGLTEVADVDGATTTGTTTGSAGGDRGGPAELDGVVSRSPGVGHPELGGVVGTGSEATGCRICVS